MNKKNKLVVISGPTAVGKTELSIQLAEQIGASIISADARQLYKEMTIGTAVPSQEQLEQVPHYFIHSHSVHQHISAGQYEKEVLEILPTLFKLNSVQFLVGGSGLYIHAVINGLDAFPETTSKTKKIIRKRLEKEGLESLVQELKKKDFAYFQIVDKHNKRRVTRALEVIEETNQPFSHFLSQKSNEHNFDILKIVLHRDREELYLKINQRVDEMMNQGLVDEAKELYEFKQIPPLQTVGYKELFDYFDNTYSLENAIELIKRNTRRYSKRQLTWFRRDKENSWLHVSQTEKIKSIIENFTDT